MMSTTNQDRFFITGATGNQGGAVASHLLSLGYLINCLVRDLSSPAATSLESRGAVLVNGDFDNHQALAQAAKDCTGVFLVTSPGSGKEVEHATNVLHAAKSAGVKVVVASTVTRAEEHESFPRWKDDGLTAPYWRGKTEIQRLVRDGGFQSWTILQPAWLMTNFLAPVSKWYWPELATEGVLLSACGKETKLQLTDSDDVGRCAAAALVESLTSDGGERWPGKTIRLASDELSMDEIADLMSRITAKKIVAKYKSDEEIEETIEKSPFVWTQVWQREDGTKVDMQLARQYEQHTSLHSFFEKNHAAILAAVNGAN